MEDYDASLVAASSEASSPLPPSSFPVLNDTTGSSTLQAVYPDISFHDMSFNSTKPMYNSKSYEIAYHDTEENILKNDEELYGKAGIWVRNKDNKAEYLEWKDISNISIYDPPKTYKYGLANYVPTYEDSVLLSVSKPTHVRYYI